MKNKLKLVIPLFLVFCLLLPAMTSNVNATTVMTAGDPLIVGINTIIKGYDGVDQSMPLSLDTVYNASMPVISLQADSFTSESQAPSDFGTDGITRTYSDALYTGFSTPSMATAQGMYSVLRYIPENEFTQYNVEQDVTAYTYTPLESYYTTVNDSMYAENVLWTAENFTVSEMYDLITFDRVMVDAFFADALAQDGYNLVASEHSTDQEMIQTMLDSVFTAYCYDIIYAPVNETCGGIYSATWTIAQEVAAVLGGNATDTSINGTMEIVSIRNAMFGYLGQHIVADSVVGQSLASFAPEGITDLIYGFAATPTTYSLKFNIMSDFAASPLSEALKVLYTILTPAEYEDLITALKANVWEGILIAAGVGAGLAIVVYLIRRDKPDKNMSTIIAFGFGSLVTLVIYFVMTVYV